MKTSLGIFIVTAALWLTPCIAHADNGDMDFSCLAKRVDQKTTTESKGDVTVNTEDWQYVVTLENKTFKDIADLDIRYIIFFKQEELGSLAGARSGRQSGTAKIALIKGNDKAEFDTIAVKLQKANLEGGRYYPNGAKPNADASLTGLWIRIYQNGSLIAEMSRPASLPSKEKWGE